MIELQSIGDWFVMLAIAGAAGLIGGIGAAFIEWRQRCAASSAAIGAKTCKPWLSALSCVVLGSIAAVAVLYFFPPTKNVVEPLTEGKTEEKTLYNLVELVALALIVGSAGASFLQAMQTRALALTQAQQAQTATATAIESYGNIPKQVEEATEAGVKAASAKLKDRLQEPMGPAQADQLVEELADEASDVVAQSIETRVQSTQRMIAAAASGEARQLKPLEG